MARHSVSYVLNVVISTAATVVSWSRVYLRPCWVFFCFFTWTHSEARGISLTEDGKEVSGALPQTLRDKSTLPEDGGLIPNVIDTYSHTTAALNTVGTHTHTHLTTLNNIETKVHCTRYYTSKTNVLHRDLDKHTYCTQSRPCCISLSTAKIYYCQYMYIYSAFNL